MSQKHWTIAGINLFAVVTDPTLTLFTLSTVGTGLYYTGSVLTRGVKNVSKSIRRRRADELAYQRKRELEIIRGRALVASLPPPPLTAEEEVAEVKRTCEMLLQQVTDLRQKGLIDEMEESHARRSIATRLRSTIIAILSNYGHDVPPQNTGS